VKRENVSSKLNIPLFCHSDRREKSLRSLTCVRDDNYNTGIALINLEGIFHNNSGQALVENILIIPILVVIIVMLFWFAEIMLTKQQLVMAARYGTDLIAYSNLNKDQIKNEIQDYLCGPNVEGRRLDPARLIDEDIDVNRKALDPLGGLQYGGSDFDRYSSHVQLYYKFDTPKLFSAWDSYIGGGNIIKKLRIGARSEVLAGTGCQGDN